MFEITSILISINQHNPREAALWQPSEYGRTHITKQNTPISRGAVLSLMQLSGEPPSDYLEEPDLRTSQIARDTMEPWLCLDAGIPSVLAAEERSLSRSANFSAYWGLSSHSP